MADPPGFSSLVPSPPLPHKVNLSPFYYGLIVVGSTALMLAVYNLVMVGVCAHQRRRRLVQMSAQSANAIPSFENSSAPFTFSTFKYSFKDSFQRVSDSECSVCLSNFEDGEDVRQMPQCKHAFHAACIDMWLFAHSDCPLCRAVVVVPGGHNRVQPEDDSREAFRDPGDLV